MLKELLRGIKVRNTWARPGDNAAIQHSGIPRRVIVYKARGKYHLRKELTLEY